MDKIKIGLDQSLSCTGVVIMQGDEMVGFSVFKTKKEEGSLFKRCLAISDYITTQIVRYNVDVVAIEGIPMGNIRGNASRDLAGLQAVLICDILRNFDMVSNIRVPTSVKKFATGSGKASKTEMVEALPDDILERFKAAGHKKTTGLQDLADAYFICKM